jgi:hypothetical protein
MMLTACSGSGRINVLVRQQRLHERASAFAAAAQVERFNRLSSSSVMALGIACTVSVVAKNMMASKLPDAGANISRAKYDVANDTTRIRTKS